MCSFASFLCVYVCVYLSCSTTSLFPPFLYAVFLRVFTCVWSSDMTWCDCSMWRVICINIVPCVNFHRMKHSLRFTPMYIFLIICDVLSLSIRCGPASVLYVCADALYDTAHHSKWSDTLYTLVCWLAITWDTDASLCWYLSTSSAPRHAYLHSKHISMHSLRFSIVLYYFQACAHSENTYFWGIHSIHVYKGPYRFSVSVTVSASIDVSLSNPATLSNLSRLLQPLIFLRNRVFVFRLMRCFFFFLTFPHQRNISTTSTRVILGS
jgi:hypothetical protein